jgi:hypothetical protein
MSHGSHSSHGSHTNTDSHNNSISAVTSDGSTLNTSTSTSGLSSFKFCTISLGYANKHTATLGGVDWSSEFSADTPLATKGSTGSLPQLVSLAEKIAASSVDTSKVDNQDRQINYTRVIPGEIPVSVPAIINGVVRPLTTRFLNRYQPGSINIEIAASAPAGGSSNPLFVTKTQTIDGTLSYSDETLTSSWKASATGRAGNAWTTYIYDNLLGIAIKRESSVFPEFFAKNITPIPSGIFQVYTTGPKTCCGVLDSENVVPSRGTRLTKEQANAIRKAFENAYISQWTGPAEKTFNITGAIRVTHSNHGNHSSS